MKAALIRDCLEVWIKHERGRWEQIEGRPSERPHEDLIIHITIRPIRLT